MSVPDPKRSFIATRKEAVSMRQAVREVNQALGGLGLEKAPDKTPDKTFIGRIEKGFDFLGYHFSPQGLTVAQQTIERFVARVTRLYEQERGKPEGFPLLGLYVGHWVRWVAGGLVVVENPAAAGNSTVVNISGFRPAIASVTGHVMRMCL